MKSFCLTASSNGEFLPCLFVWIQFTAIASIFLSGPIIPSDNILLGIELSGLALGLWSIAAHKGLNFSIAPVHKAGANLLTAGPYRIIRHPMYLAVILTISPLLINLCNWQRISIVMILIIDLILKLEYEEKQLVESFDSYREYQKKSWKLIPLVY